MNECYIWGKIVSDIDFKFFYNSKEHISVVTFEVKPFRKNVEKEEESKIMIVGYDNIADYLYQSYKRDSIICARCEIRENKVTVMYVYN